MANDPRYSYHNATVGTTKVDVSQVIERLNKLSPAVRGAMVSYLDSRCEELEFWMRNNRPWRDRTFQARRNLRAQVKNRKDDIGIVLSHNVEYGRFLEEGTRHANAYPILNPTAKRYFPEIYRGMRGLLRNKRYMKWM